MALREGLARLRMEFDPLSILQLASVLTIFTLFMIIPLMSIVYHAFFVGGMPSLYWFSLIFSDPFYLPISVSLSDGFPFLKVSWRVTGELMRLSGDTLLITGADFGVIANSVLVALFTTLFSTAMGTALAFIMARYRFPGKDVLRVLILVPLISMPFVGAVGILKMIGIGGSVNQLLYEVSGALPFRIVVDGLAAVVIVQSLHFYAITYLTAYSALVNIDPTLEEQAENMGARGFHLFRTVTLPLALPGIEAGAILTFILSIEDLGAPIVFQHSLARKTLVYQIYSQVFSPTGEVNPIAPALSTILLAIALIGFLSIRKYVSLRSYAMISRGGAWQPRIRRLSPVATISVYVFIAAVLSLALMPQIGVILLSIAEVWGNTVLPAKVTLSNYGILFAKPSIAQAIINSLIYATAATGLMVVLGTGAAYLIARKQVAGMSTLDSLMTLPIAIPGIVVALGYFTTFLNTPLSPVVNPVPLIILAYAVRRSPFTVRAAFAGLQQTHVSLEEASLNLGANRTQTFLRITVPLIAVNVIAGSMLSFVYSISEVSTSIVLGGVNPTYAPITWKMMDVLFQVAAGPFQAAVLGVLLMSIQVIVMTVATGILRQRTAALVGV